MRGQVSPQEPGRGAGSWDGARRCPVLGEILRWSFRLQGQKWV